MREIFSTVDAPPASAFGQWQQVIGEQFTAIELEALEPGPFVGSIAAARIGGVDVSRMASDPMRSDGRYVPRGRFDREMLVVNIVLEGSFTMQVDGREAVVRPGGFVVNDGTPWAFLSPQRTETLSVEVPRRRFEDVLGPSRLYAGLGIDGKLGGASLATGFMRELVKVEQRMDDAARVRVASAALDLFVAAIAEGLARETPTSVLDGVVVQRAKAHIESRFRDPRLTPALVAGASGVSLRRLQELFKRSDQGVAERIWERRLSAAALALGDPGSLDRPIGSLAFACGFANQAHFSTRFRARFGIAPRDYRARAMEAQFGPGGAPDGEPTSPDAGRRSARIPRTPPC